MENYFNLSGNTNNNCFNKILSINYAKSNALKTDLNILLDEIITTDIFQFYFTSDVTNRVISKLCKLSSLSQTNLLHKILQSIQAILDKTQIRLNNEVLDEALEFTLASITKGHESVILTAIYALAKLLREECNRTRQFHSSLLGQNGLLDRLLHENLDNPAYLIGIVLCIENITFRVEESSDYLDKMYIDTCYNCLMTAVRCNSIVVASSISSCKVVISAFRSVMNILTASNCIDENHLGPLLAACRVYMTYGLKPHPITVPDSLHPLFRLPYSSATSSTSANSVSAERKVKKHKTRKPKQADDGTEARDDVDGDISSLATRFSSVNLESDVLNVDGNWGLTSESEYSDCELSSLQKKLRSSAERVRHSALACLCTVNKISEKKVMFGYWVPFMPDAGSDISTVGDGQNLFTVGLKDPSSKCRLSGFLSLSSFLNRSKEMLSPAEYSEYHSGKFMTFSQTLGCILQDIHNYLLAALVREDYPRVITQIIKSFSLLVGNAPYGRLMPGLLTKLVSKLRHFVHHRDINVRVGCMTCFGAMCSISPPLLEVQQILSGAAPPLSSSISESFSKSDQYLRVKGDKLYNKMLGEAAVPADDRNSSEGSGANTPTVTIKRSWLVKLCLKAIYPAPQSEQISTEPIPLRLESLQVLTYVASNYLPIASEHVDVFNQLIQFCLSDVDPDIQLHGAKLWHEVVHAYIRHTDLVQNITDKLLSYWNGHLEGEFIRLLQDDSISCSLRVALCECLSCINAGVFTSLSRSKQILCVTLVLGMVHDTHPAIKASAVRCLGVYCLYPSLSQDMSFLYDCSTCIFQCLCDTTVTVRIRAAWSLGNVFDTLYENRSTFRDNVEEFPRDLMWKLLQSAVRLTVDNKKTCYNAVHSVGSGLQYLQPRDIECDEHKEILQHCLTSLLKCINTGIMKVRWNACHSLRCLMKNHNIHPFIFQDNDLAVVLKNLCKVSISCRIFKVKIAAVSAIVCLDDRLSYGSSDSFASVWTALVDTLVAADTVGDFVEPYHRRSLLDQTCQGIFHLRRLSTAMDLSDISIIPCDKWQKLCEYIENWSRTASDRDDQLCIENLSKLDDGQLSQSQTDGLQRLSNLHDIYVNQITEASSGLSQKTAFVQIYD